ncbi:MAG: hypothetical protein LBQ80_05720 [Clostridium sp.]|jgi:MraZ protein|nr:hypothetical protein [Clostridium sp.]
MIPFWGTSEHSLDGQNRLLIPKDLRPLLGESFYVFSPVLSAGSTLPHLVAMPEAKYENYIRRVRGSYEGQLRDRLLRKLSANVQTCSTDSAGRVSLSEGLREFAGLNGKVLIVGVGDRLELWNPERFDEDIAREPDGDDETGGVPLDDDT